MLSFVFGDLLIGFIDQTIIATMAGVQHKIARGILMNLEEMWLIQAI